jgi:hypothetical protein
MGQKAAPAFSHPGPSPTFRPRARIVETRVEEHDLDELCAFARLSDAVDGMKNRFQ